MDVRVLTAQQVLDLRAALLGRRIVLCYGGGVDSTAMIVALREAGIRPDLLTFADTGAEKPETYEFVRRIDTVLAEYGWPLVSWCKKQTKADTGYTDLTGNCIENETLPSLAFGMKSCSIKWKHGPQDQFLKGVKAGPNKRDPHPLWIETQARGERIVKLIGYDNGKADLRRSKNAPTADAEFDFVYPLQVIGWDRAQCVKALVEVLGAEWVPVKSACFFCPASKPWELFWLAGHHPELFEKALHLERVALTGRHSRFDKVEFGADWEDLVKNADRFPSSNTTVGLGRKFAWSHWARLNGVVDPETWKVREDQRERCRKTADALRDSLDNAFDGRSCGLPHAA